jgi:DnaK suppressor protein
MRRRRSRTNDILGRDKTRSFDYRAAIAQSVDGEAAKLAAKNRRARMGEHLSSLGVQRMKAEVVIDAEYRPAEDEPFMNNRQKEYFRRKLLDWKESILGESKGTIVGLQEDTRNIPDLADRASAETDRALELRTRDRQRKLISKIDAALRRIDENVYGYCEETGEPISLKRLDARPIATLSLEAQEKHERREKVYRDD